MEIEKKIEATMKKIQKLEERREKDKQTIKELNKELEQLESQRIVGIVNELNIPISQLKEFLKNNAF